MAYQKSWMSGVLAAIVLCLGAMALLTCADDNADVAEISEELADRLTDALEFEDGEVQPDPPPPEHANNSEYPQVSIQSRPSVLAFNTPFSIVLSGDYAQPARVRGAVIHVAGTRRHILVSKVLNPLDNTMTLSARIIGVAALYDKRITIRIALVNDSGDVGNYLHWTFDTPKLPGTADAWWRCDPDDSGSWHKYIEDLSLRECLQWCAQDDDILCDYRLETGFCACSWDRDRTGEL